MNMKSRLTVALLSIASMALLTQQFFLLRVNQALRVKISILNGEQIPIGAKLPAIVGVDLEGRRVEYLTVEQKSPTLVFTLSSGCPACQRSLDAWNQLAVVASAHAINTVVVSSDWFTTAKEFIAAGHTIPGTLVLNPTYSTFIGLRLKVTPHALLILPGGEIAHVWQGAIDEAMKEQIIRALEAP
jgi:peroxiredoxin